MHSHATFLCLMHHSKTDTLWKSGCFFMFVCQQNDTEIFEPASQNQQREKIRLGSSRSRFWSLSRSGNSMITERCCCFQPQKLNKWRLRLETRCVHLKKMTIQKHKHWTIWSYNQYPRCSLRKKLQNLLILAHGHESSMFFATWLSNQ